MTKKTNLLVIGKPDNDLPDGLLDYAEKAGVSTTVCSPEKALQILSNKADFLAVLAVDDGLEGGDDHLSVISEKINDLSLQMLILGNEVTRARYSQMPGVVVAGEDESPEMLKGRLMMLLELQGHLKQVYKQMEVLRSVGQPVSQYIDKVDEEMRLAARLQRDFLPKKLPEIAGLTFASVYRPATWVSGDIYDVMRLDERHIGFYVADVVGHGMPAALLTMFIKRALVTKRITGNKYELVAPDEALAALNVDFLEQKLSNFQFATAIYGMLNIQTLQLSISAAGHPYPLWINSQGQLREMKLEGPLLGVFTGQRYTTEEFTLEPGDKLLLYSDGVEVAFNEETSGEAVRYRQEFLELASRDISSMCSRLVELIEQEEGSLHPRDDVTIVGLEIERDFSRQ